MKKAFLQLIFALFAVTAQANQTLSYGVQHQLQSKALDETRTFTVHLPADYSNKNQQKYPVLYLLHGQHDFLSTVAIVDKLVDNNEMPEMIIVGINSKGPELKPINVQGKLNQRGQQFTRFLHDELIGHINQTYRTADFRILSGHSLAGLFVLNNMLDQPGQFNGYFSFSPALATDNNQFIQRVLKERANWFNLQTKLTLTLASEGDAVAKPYQQLVNQLKATKASKISLAQQKFADYSHSTTTFPSMLFALNQLFKNYAPDWSDYSAGLAGIQRHYDSVSALYGFEVAIPLSQIQFMAVSFSVNFDNKYQPLLPDLVAYALKRSPNSIARFADSIQWMRSQTHSQPAAHLTELVCQQVPNDDFCRSGHLPLK